MDFDSLLEKTGGFGRLQFLVIGVYLPLIMSFGAFAYCSQLLILLVPDHVCKLPNDYDASLKNLTKIGQCSLTGAMEDPPLQSYNSWTNVLSAFYHAPSNLNSVTPGCVNGWEYDISNMYETVASEHNWVCDDSWKVSFSHTAYWIGSTVGYFFSGFFLDSFGRWKVGCVLVLVQTVATLSTIFTSGVFPLFCVCRFLSGLSAMPMQTSTFTLCVELILPRKRKVIGVLSAIYWLSIAAASPWLALLLRNWRMFLVVAVCNGPLLLIMMKFIPESPRWLLSRGETEKAFKVLSYVSKVNGVSDLAALNKMKEYALSSSAPVPRRENVFKTTASLLLLPNVRRKTLLIFLAWFSVCLSYHGNNLGHSKSEGNVFLLYSLGALLEIPICFVYLFTVDRVGRKPPILLSLMVVAVVAPVAHLIHHDSTWVHFSMNIIVRGLFSLAYNVLFQLGCELFPTVVRGRGVFIMRTFGDIGTSIAPFILDANAVWPLTSSVIFSALSVTCGFITLWLPETLGKSLPQTLSEAEEFGHGKESFLSTFSCCVRDKKPSSRSSTADLLSTSSSLSISSDGGSLGKPYNLEDVSVHL